jgi:hypothetical protein
VSKTVWHDRPCIVAAPGPSLSAEQAELCAEFNVIAVNDAYRLFPNAAALYAADIAWWEYHNGCPDFKGEKLTCPEPSHDVRWGAARKRTCKAFGIAVVKAHKGSGFSLDPSFIHFGTNSGFQATNIAVVRGAVPIILIGFDMHGSHFFGEHPPQLRKTKRYDRFIDYFNHAARTQPQLKIVNASGPHSRLSGFPMVSLKETLDACRNTQS